MSSSEILVLGGKRTKAQFNPRAFILDMKMPEGNLHYYNTALAVVKNVKEHQSFSVLSIANQAKRTNDDEIIGIVQDKDGDHQLFSYKREDA